MAPNPKISAITNPVGDDAATVSFTVTGRRRGHQGIDIEGHGRVQISGVATIETGAVVIRSLSVATETADITTALLRKIPLGAIRDEVSRLLHEPEPERYLNPNDPIQLSTASPRGQEAPTRSPAQLISGLKGRSPARGRSARSDDFYHGVAEAYLRRLSTHPRNPTDALTEELRKSSHHHDLKRGTVAAWIRKAREQGWLSPSTPGKAGANPGSRLLDARKEALG